MTMALTGVSVVMQSPANTQRERERGAITRYNNTSPTPHSTSCMQYLTLTFMIQTFEILCNFL